MIVSSSEISQPMFVFETRVGIFAWVDSAANCLAIFLAAQ
jgi:hypothetical protein